ncbi:hypothetical protein FACS1894189_2360 [Planctomycetales bacterium]|nr:hypothetical protein FACS1894189_2360 [Planctomycetales bacterium]
MAQLATRTSETQMQMEGLKGTIYAINNLPFTILANVFKDLLGYAKSIGSEFNERWNGLPGIILKVTAIFSALVVIIGLAATSMDVLNGKVTYLKALWNSSMIVQGFAGFATLLGGIITSLGAIIAQYVVWIAQQWQLNIAMYANPIGIIVAAIVVAVALTAALAAAIMLAWRWWSNSAKAAEEMKNRIAEMEASTAAFRDRMGEAVNRYKELNNLAKQYHEANLTGAQKYENKLKEIDEVLNKHNTAKNMEAQFQGKYDEMKAAWDNAKAAEEKNAIAEEMKKLVSDWEGFRKELKNAPKLSAADAAAAKEAARLEYLKNRYGNLIEETLTPQQQYADTLKNLAEDLKAGRILQNEYNNAAAKAKAELEKNDPVMQERRKKEEEINKQYQQLVDKFKGMVPEKSPVEAFKELSEQLIAVGRTLSKEEYANAQKKMLDDLAKGLGVEQYLKPDDSLMTSQQKLSDVYSRLAEYQQNSAMTAGELAEAQKRAAAALEKQSPMYALMQEAQKKLMMGTGSDRITETIFFRQAVFQFYRAA